MILRSTASWGSLLLLAASFIATAQGQVTFDILTPPSPPAVEDTLLVLEPTAVPTATPTLPEDLLTNATTATISTNVTIASPTTNATVAVETAIVLPEISTNDNNSSSPSLTAPETTATETNSSFSTSDATQNITESSSIHSTDAYNTTTSNTGSNNSSSTDLYSNNKTSYPSGADDYSSSSSSYGDDSKEGDAYYGADGKADKKAYDEDIEQYYGALSVAILTLGLILCVEEFRHRLDHSAVGRPFFQSVLDGVYRELATLGVVELAVHLLQTYGELDKERKAVFADVHFLLFYTAIFNAFQAAILAVCSSRVSFGLWVKTEELELDHYVEIREEFDRIHEELYGAPVPRQSGETKQKKSFTKSFRSYAAAFDAHGEGGMMASIKRFFLAAVYTVIFPRKKAKYNQLLVQVRFHELRVHFLESYDLPLKMKVSDYLVKSQQHVLEHFVHVSHSTWLILTAFCNILYFVTGIAADVSGVAETSGYSLSLIFFCAMVVFVVLSVAVYYHMESIFKKLMKAKHLWNVHDEDEKDSTRKGELAAQQEEMFVLGDPHLILQSVKFMQFGYAIALAIVFVYWDDMEADDDFHASAYIMSTLFCYTVFVAVMARVLPLYTVCTSMGQLVDKERLHEVRAAYCLEEAERRRHEDRSVKRHQANMMKKGHESSNSLSTFEVFEKDPVSNHDSASSAVPMVVDGGSSTVAPVKDKRAMLADLVKMDTMSLRQVVPSSERDQRRSFSDGVNAMRLLGMSMNSFSTANNSGSGLLGASETSTESSGNRKVTFDDTAVAKQATNDRRAARRNRRKTQSASADIQAMRDFNNGRLDSQGDPHRGPAMDLEPITEKPSTLPPPETSVDGAAKAFITNATEKASPVENPTDNTMAAPVFADVLNVVPEQPELESPTATAKVQQKISDDETSVSNLSDVENTAGWELEGSLDGSHDEEHPPLSISQRFALFFEGQTYTFLTHIIGTMVAFFLIGMRVEGFLKEQCIIPYDDHSWDFKLPDSFRLLVAWISMFMAISVVKVIISREHKQTSFVLAAVVDFVLCGLCLVFLLVAENQRCCKDSGEPDIDTALLEEELYDFRMLQGSDECVDSTFECACEDFGTRTYGGLGNLEPWTALLGLRVFRFTVAKRIVKYLKIEYTKHSSGDDHHGHGHGHGGVGEKGTAVELWQSAMARCPDLVDKHGEFSAEVLQVMLGIEVIESEPAIPAKIEDSKEAKAPIEGPDASTMAVPVEPMEEREHVFLESSKYSKLTPAAQEIIAAGKMGLPVKPCLKKSSKFQAYAAAPMAPLEFEVDEKVAQAEHDNHDVSLSYPNARLVRSMRRCERKLMPLLNKWTVVDVAITNHEMVYVEVCESDESDISAEDLKRREASRSAVIATGGGKGLRLCDVTAGRRVVGHMSFSDIHTVHVEREVPSADSVPTGEVPGAEEQNEYWLPEKREASSADSRQLRWETVNQDRLKLVTLHGTLYLRFHSDLFDSEMHPERILEEVGDESPLHKDIAFQWAQTIVRHCGVSQLHQDLPHFGHNDGDELRDYLQIVKHHEKKHSYHHRRLSSLSSFNYRRMGSTDSTGLGRAHSFKRKNSKAKKPPVSSALSIEADEKTGNLVIDI